MKKGGCGFPESSMQEIISKIQQASHISGSWPHYALLKIEYLRQTYSFNCNHKIYTCNKMQSLFISRITAVTFWTKKQPRQAVACLSWFVNMNFILYQCLLKIFRLTYDYIKKIMFEFRSQSAHKNVKKNVDLKINIQFQVFF